MAAPWGIEFDENIFVFFDHDLVVVLGDDNGDRPFLLLGNGLRLDAWLHLAINKVLNEATNIGLGQLLALVKWKFLVLDGLLDGERGPLVNFQIQVAGVSAESFGVNSSKADRTLVLFSQGLQGRSEFRAFFRSLSEDIRERDTRL